MEDVKAYIESGVLELYVLGVLSAEEKAQVEAMAANNPAVKAELGEIEQSIELYAKHNEVEPEDSLRDRIMNSLVTNLGDDRIFKTKPASELEAKVVTLTQQKQSNFFKYAFAACLALLILSVAALYTVYNRLQDTQGQLVAVQLQSQKFSSRVNLLDRELNVLRDPSFKLIKLGPGPAGPGAGLAVAWSPSKKEVMIDMSRANNLKPNDKDHSYQLWALVNGKPVDLGVFDVTDSAKDMIEMKSIDKADAFAVTLEPHGGLPAPTLTNLMVIGKTEISAE
ncbi:anti-sigma factor [Mucilaginibacter ginkgonis]|uniref:Regulator of SigK n=1 Tax=Mucilaginibacter ginkgonis TaxID=2682091 RepID=A0A6I4I4Q6_9SPHI|nr:anti-sigma factor [Mucilaginibacter ginkgonis]QQL48995.1 anti-sigma factor [Mucilaginibacter ginkgonis]